MTEEPELVVGIDLGTSNCALAYAELSEVKKAGRPIIHAFEVPQLVAPGDVQTRRLLPSAMYAPAGFELTAGQTDLPWRRAESGLLNVVGEAAKWLGAKAPVRLVESAKSWLCHGGVNRTSAILPWHAPDEVPKVSPVEASAAYLEHLCMAWDHVMAASEPARALAKQRVVITVPASFDEFSRRLTLEATKKAGLEGVTLIEEPLAAFYAFMARTGGTPRTTGLSGGERVLVADVGGGTTDFTLVDVRPPATGGEQGILQFERTAVGDHLLLGGDNMDLALAHAVEPQLTKGSKLDAEGWAQLKLECRLAKETLFNHREQDSLPVVVTGRGSKLIGSARRGKLSRSLLEQVVLEGYFPVLPAGGAAKSRRSSLSSGFTEYGLPYAAEPGITRHLAAFLMRHAGEGSGFARVDAILFNGGTLKPPLIRDRVSGVLGAWMRETGDEGPVPDPRALIYDEGDDVLELAVARGAAYFGLVREGLGVRVGGGSPREYFLEVGGEEAASAPATGSVRVLCVAPRGMQDGQTLDVPNREMSLVTNRPVQFPLFATTSPRKDPVGSVVEVDAEELHRLPPLQTVVKYGKQKAGTKVPVGMQVRRTELGTLELSCLSRVSGTRFKLEFDLRSTEDPGESPDPGTGSAHASGSAVPSVAEAEPFGGAGTRPPPEQGEVEVERLEAAKVRISRTFAEQPPRPEADALMKGLEADLALDRNALPLPALRAVGEHLLELMDRRALAPALEARWLNVTGFCLRPGFGVPVDDWRVRQLWKIHGTGLQFPGHEPAQLNWWILWRRVAGGLSRGHQEELSSRLFPLIQPGLYKRAKQKPPRPKTQLAAEMWRAAASLERISAKSRAQLGDALMELLEGRKAPKGAPWCLGRIGARKLFYGPREATVRANTARQWAQRLMRLPRPPKDEDLAGCLVSLGRLTGDRQFDLKEEERREIRSFLLERDVRPVRLKPLVEVVAADTQAQHAAFGEGLPTGLVLA